jgi:hypothetical protein
MERERERKLSDDLAVVGPSGRRRRRGGGTVREDGRTR